MKLSIRWDKIKEGFRGFEKLAYDYVSDNYPNPSWEKTKETRDGNKDAVAVFFGYQSYLGGTEKWWMEAKYSSSLQYITRYRLDSTIVSAILEKNIKKIIFVTNISINAKTINDIRNALYNSIQCKEVIFCTKYTLEYWLALNKNIFLNYFEAPNYQGDFEIEKPQKFVIHEIEYYSEISNKFSFKEPLRELFKGETYIGYFEIFSPDNLKSSLRVDKGVKGLTILSDSTIFLTIGENPIKFSFKIDENYENIQNGIETSPMFLLDDMPLLSANYIILSQKKDTHLNLTSQTELISTLTNAYLNFIKKPYYNFHFIDGISGSGKSYILDCLIKNISVKNEELFYAEFSNSARNNSEILINLLIFILFPYLAPSEVDYLYLKNINKNYISSTILGLVKKKNDMDEVAKEIDRLNFEDGFFTSKMEINKRIIILDNLQNLSQAEKNFLAVLLIDIKRNNIPIYFVGTAQPAFFKNKSFLSIQQYCVAKHYFNNIGINDIFKAISCEQKSNFYFNKELAYSLDLNILEILVFSKYILDNDMFSKDIHDFIFTWKIFQKSNIMENHVINQFNTFFELYPNCRTLCDQIYWACEPIAVNEDNNKTEIALLISNCLAKYNYDALLVPYHDIYKSYYREHFKPKDIKELYFAAGSPEALQFCLHNEFKKDILNKAAEEVFCLLKENKFYSVIYILQDLFEQTSNVFLRNKFDKNTYYKLYYAYALAAKHQSTQKTGFQIFTELSNEINDIDTLEILLIQLEVSWELAISFYERLQYQEVNVQIQQIYSIIKKIQKTQKANENISDNLKFHDALMLDTLVKANKGSSAVHELYLRRVKFTEKKGFRYRSESFQIRYSLTLSTTNIRECLKILKKCRSFFKEKYGDEDKYYLWSSYHYLYYKMILEEADDLLKDVIYFHDAMKKRFFENYRNRINGMATYFYSKGEVTLGNQYLLQETIFVSDLQARQKAFHYETVALHELNLKNYSNAINSLEKAANLFNELPTYQIIPLHNIETLKNISEPPIQIEYWWGERLRKNIYYVDSRCTW